MRRGFSATQFAVAFSRQRGVASRGTCLRTGVGANVLERATRRLQGSRGANVGFTALVRDNNLGALVGKPTGNAMTFNGSEIRRPILVCRQQAHGPSKFPDHLLDTPN
jgi:hypothetical protein